MTEPVTHGEARAGPGDQLPTREVRHLAKERPGGDPQHKRARSPVEQKPPQAGCPAGGISDKDGRTGLSPCLARPHEVRVGLCSLGLALLLEGEFRFLLHIDGT